MNSTVMCITTFTDLCIEPPCCFYLCRSWIYGLNFNAKTWSLNIISALIFYNLRLFYTTTFPLFVPCCMSYSELSKFWNGSQSVTTMNIVYSLILLPTFCIWTTPFNAADHCFLCCSQVANHFALSSQQSIILIHLSKIFWTFNSIVSTV